MRENINIGILGTSRIAQRAIIEPARKIKDVKIYAVASREKSKALKYAENNNIPCSFGSYDELLRCENIDIVYISLITKLHAEWALKAIKAKKHILVEKPLCLTENDAILIKKEAEKSNVQVLEAVMTQHHLWVDKLKEIIKDKTYGELCSIESFMSFILQDNNDFRLQEELGGGVFYDESAYWLHLTQICFGLKAKSKNFKIKNIGSYKIDLTTTASLKFGNNKYSRFTCSYELPFSAHHIIKFKYANLQFRNFLKPSFGDLKFDLIIINDDRHEKIIFPPCNFYTNQLNFFIDVIKKGRENINLDESIERIKIMENLVNL